MAYEKIGFINGQVLKAEDLNHIEEGVLNASTQSDWNQNDNEAADYIKNKPDIIGTKGWGEHAEIFNDYENNSALGDYSHAEGKGTIANMNEHAQGVYNIQSELVTSYIESAERQFGGGEFNNYTTYYRVLSDITYNESMECYVFDDYEELEHNFKIKAGDIIPIGIHSDNPYACDAYYYIVEANIVDANDYNICDVYKYTTSKVERSEYAHVVGNGTSNDSRSNAYTLDWDGNAWFAGDVYIGSNSGVNKDEGSKKLATEEYIDTKEFDSLILKSENKKFKLTINDEGTLSTIEIT